MGEPAATGDWPLSVALQYAAATIPGYEIVEELEFVDEDPGVVRNDFAPALPVADGVVGNFHEPEVLRMIVRANVELVAKLIDGILVAALARLDDVPCLARLIRG